MKDCRPGCFGPGIYDNCSLSLCATYALDNRGRTKRAFIQILCNVGRVLRPCPTVSNLERVRNVGLSDTCQCSRSLAGTKIFMRLQVLTSSIVMGWLLAVTTLGQWSSLGYVKGTIGGAYAATSMLLLKADCYLVSAFYALTFGLLGLIPVPRASRKRKL